MKTKWSQNRRILGKTSSSQNSAEVKILLFAEFLISLLDFIKTFQVFLIEGIKCTEAQECVYLQYGLWFALSQGIFIVWLHRYSKSEKFFRHFTIFMALVLYFTKSYAAPDRSAFYLCLWNAHSLAHRVLRLRDFA